MLTPTLVRATLKRLCDSIDMQTDTDWEHIVIVDCVPTPEQEVILKSIEHPHRRIVFCTTKHEKDFGNCARRQGFDIAQGEYILQIDDDDYYADDKVFETLRCVTKTWAAFPVLALGKRCHRKPPAIYLTGSAMFMYRRDTGCKFPDNTDYSADGQLVEELKAKFPYETLDDCRELVIYEQANKGRDQQQIDDGVEIVIRDNHAQNRPLRKIYRYAKDGLTVDWFDYNR